MPLSSSFVLAPRGGHQKILQRPSEISPQVSATERRGWSSQARRSGWSKRLPERGGTTPRSSSLSFGYIQQSILTIADPHTTPLKSFSHTSSLSSVSHPLWTHTSNWRGQVLNNRSFQSDLADSHLSHFPLTPRCTTHAALHSHLSLPHYRHIQFFSLLPLLKRLGCARYHEVATPQLPLLFQGYLKFFSRVCV